MAHPLTIIWDNVWFQHMITDLERLRSLDRLYHTVEADKGFVRIVIIKTVVEFAEQRVEIRHIGHLIAGKLF
ncbi:hypothetical protein ASF66_13355 [Pseudomonas sp. Leaf129]|nr:hypothetical protein ASF66_13355 [Pseudomonas sp. Leaf129]